MSKSKRDQQVLLNAIDFAADEQAEATSTRAQATRLQRRTAIKGAVATDLAQLLTEKGEIVPAPEPARQLAEFLTMLVVDATIPSPDELAGSRVACPRRSGKKQCTGTIETAAHPDANAILWHCLACGNKGVITNWMGTLWDCGGFSTAH